VNGLAGGTPPVACEYDGGAEGGSPPSGLPI
jgi:hypothetical protein